MPANGYGYLWEAAAEHGRQGDPDHEVGDLQDCLREAWKVMNEEQRQKVLNECEHVCEWHPDARWEEDNDG